METMTQPPSIGMTDDYHFNLLPYHKPLPNEANDLLIAQQKILELTGINHELQQQLSEQHTTIQTLNAHHIDSQTKMDSLEAENAEYQRIINQTNDKYEEAIHELSITREHLSHATDQIQENQHTMQSLNHDLLRIAKNDTPVTSTRNGYHPSDPHSPHHTMEEDDDDKQTQKYEQLLLECQKYRDDHRLLIQQDIQMDTLRQAYAKMEQRNKQLSDQIVELTYHNVHLEKETNDYTQQMEQQNALIQYLQTEHQTLMVPEAAAHTEDVDTPISINVKTPKNHVRQKYFHSSNNGSTSVTPHAHQSDHSHPNVFDDKSMRRESTVEGSDLFTVVQNYEDNNEYLEENHADMDALDPLPLHLSSCAGATKHVANKGEKLDALEEYLHLTASAIKIKYPLLDASINEMLAMVRNVPFYNAYEYLDKYMMDKMTQLEDRDAYGMESGTSPTGGANKSVKQLFKNILHKRNSIGNLKLSGLGKAKAKKVNVPKRKHRTIIKIQRPNKAQKSIIDYDKLEEKLRIHEEKLKAAAIVETVPPDGEREKKKKRITLKRPSLQKRDSSESRGKRKKNKKLYYKTET